MDLPCCVFLRVQTCHVLWPRPGDALLAKTFAPQRSLDLLSLQLFWQARLEHCIAFEAELLGLFVYYTKLQILHVRFVSSGMASSRSGKLHPHEKCSWHTRNYIWKFYPKQKNPHSLQWGFFLNRSSHFQSVVFTSNARILLKNPRNMHCFEMTDTRNILSLLPYTIV